MKNKKIQKMFVDQYGQKYFAHTIKELCAVVSSFKSPKISKMYRDKKDGSTVHCGYIIGGLWLTAFIPLEIIQ